MKMPSCKWLPVSSNFFPTFSVTMPFMKKKKKREKNITNQKTKIYVSVVFNNSENCFLIQKQCDLEYMVSMETQEFLKITLFIYREYEQIVCLLVDCKMSCYYMAWKQTQNGL